MRHARLLRFLQLSFLGVVAAVPQGNGGFSSQGSAVPFGEIIVHCNRPGVIALTFDDGPCPYTSDLLNILDEYNVKATFFINGNNMAPDITNRGGPWPAVLQRMFASGHQLASHTWTHQDLTAVGYDERWSQMTRNERVFLDVLGVRPVYMRPPYGSCDSHCLETMGDMGYHVVNWNVDTNDWQNQGAIQVSMGAFDNIVGWDPAAGSYIVLAHDVQHDTVYSLARHMITTAEDRGYKLVTVGECLGDPKEKWYTSRQRW